MFRSRFLVLFSLFLLLHSICTAPARAQNQSDYRGTALDMLDAVSRDVQKRYYDPKFHGVDWPAVVRDTKAKIKTSDSLNLGMAHIAQALVSLNDSHTVFLPPPRPYIHDYGFRMKMIGDRCYVSRVRPGSDAEAQGLAPGDEILAYTGVPPNREILWKLEYRFEVLRPQDGVTLVLRDPQGRMRQVEVKAKFKQLERVRDLTGNGIWQLIRDEENDEHLQRARWAEVGDDVAVLKLPVFEFEQTEVESMVGKARKRPALILDLRDNPGGAVDTLKWLVGGMFDKDVKIADRVGRKESKPQVAKSRGRNYTGKLVVLVDSRSASASELFARLMQIEKRGVVMGDHSSGSVMEAKSYDYGLGVDTKIFFGAEITESDLIMTDGKSLEHVGVTPDEVVLPTPADMAAGRDPVLARAAAMLGAKLTPEQAGKMFPYEWPRE